MEMTSDPTASRGGQGQAEGFDAAGLVARIAAGEVQAEEELVHRFSRGLFLMLQRLSGNPSLAEDLRQETLRVVLEKVRRREIRQPEALVAFVRSTAKNLFIADRRKEARYHPLAEGVEEGMREPRGVEPLPRITSQLDRVLRDEEARQVRRLLQELRYEKDRQLLIRFYLSDDSKEEICEDLEVAPERFHRVLYRARQRLRELWERAEKRRRLVDGLS